MESCTEVREEIIALISDDEVAEEAQKWIDYQRAIDNALDIAQEYISKQAISKADEQTTSSSAEHKQLHLKLPKLELPKFDGDVLKFQNFWDQFEVAIHDNDNVPSVQKFTYLRSVLEGIAYHTIEGFEVTSANYQHAVDALKHRFGRKRIIISSLVKSIIQLPRSNEGVEFLRDLHDTLKNRIRALEALGEKPTTHSCILLPILETKLPPELSEKWELELTDTKEESVDLELFFKFLNKQVISKEAGKRNASMIGENGGTARGSGGRNELPSIDSVADGYVGEDTVHNQENSITRVDIPIACPEIPRKVSNVLSDSLEETQRESMLTEDAIHRGPDGTSKDLCGSKHHLVVEPYEAVT
ncbi:uncharacterized protein LOC111346609 [Stylophora pistillata]|uniref:uncharacterized protein LOC111346609 n=1 Tax=Stylophora pistillata TaxID=50429 RepID=UPI000C054359|nr:uncharacterized protein LOC111346609 [Stylophora pistillata]